MHWRKSANNMQRGLKTLAGNCAKRAFPRMMPVRILCLFAMIAASGCYRSSGESNDDTDQTEYPDASNTDRTVYPVASDTEPPASDTEQATDGDIGDTNQVVDQEYDQGVYHCCAKGQGTSCCEGYEQGMCFEYGGIYGDCIEQGEEYEAKVICARCCDGLERAEEMVVTDDDWTEQGYLVGCGPSGAPPSIGICVDCNDGLCGPGENVCICPEDCS